MNEPKHEEAINRPHWTFWLIGVVALIWNGGGVVNYFVQMDPEMVAGMNRAAQAVVENRPAWATGSFAVSVFGGALGALLLLMRKSASFYVFIVSLAGTILTILHTYNVATSNEEIAGGGVVGYMLVPIAVAAFFVWFSRDAGKKGWIS